MTYKNTRTNNKYNNNANIDNTTNKYRFMVSDSSGFTGPYIC